MKSPVARTWFHHLVRPNDDFKTMRRIIITAIVLILVPGTVYFPLPEVVQGQEQLPTMTLSQTVQSGSSPDLIIENITWSPDPPSMGDTVTFTVTVRNQGSEAAGQFRVAGYIDDEFLTSVLASPLDAGDTSTVSFTWQAEAGSHTIKAVADSAAAITESDEANNEHTLYFSALAPDLIIQTLTWTPESPSKGDTIAFNITIKNQGTGMISSSHVYFYINDASRGFQEVPRLDAGATANATFSWVAQAGPHELRAVVDKFDLLAESDEGNNEKTLSFIILAPDLVVEKLTWTPENPSESDNVTFTIGIKNQGSGKADYSTVAYYIDNKYIDVIALNPIDAGVTDNQTFNWIAKPGPHQIKVIADFRERVVESDENNNETTILFAPQAPDLIIGAITWSPESPSIGETVTFSVPVRNQGNGTASTSRTYLYVDGSPVGYEVTASIAADGTVTETFTWEAMAGSHTVKVIADKNNQVLESDESNNGQTVIFSGVSFGDLVIEDITWQPASPAIGDSVTFTIIIKNQGSGTADISRVAYYINNEYLSSIAVSSINAGATDNKTFTWTAEVGLHEIKALADYNVKVTETDEYNNEKTVSFSPRAPDLIIQSITPSTGEASAGDSIDFTVTVENQGQLRAGTSRVQFYIDGASLGYQELPEINAGAALSRTFAWTTLDGTHDIRAVADAATSVVEADENNNEKTIIFSIPPPDLLIEEITLSPEIPSIGETVALTVAVMNQGSGTAADSNIHLYSNDLYIDSQNTKEIAPGATASKTFALIVQEGDYTIRAITDGDGHIAESDEDNNEKSLVFTVLPPPEPGTEPTPTPAPPPAPKPSEESVYLDVPNTEVSAGKDVVLNISASNLIGNPAMTVKLDLEIPTGMSLTSDNFTPSDGTQYTASYIIKPGDIQQIEVHIGANQEGSYTITGQLIYYFGDDETAGQSQAISLPITVGPAAKEVAGPTAKPTPEEETGIDWRLILAGIGVIGLITTLYIVLRPQR